MLSIRAHLVLMLLAEITVFLLVPTTSLFLSVWLLPQLLPIPMMFYAYGLLPFLLAGLATHFACRAIRGLFWHRIPARCAIPGCPGAAYCTGSRPFRYDCSRCGYSHATRVSEEA